MSNLNTINPEQLIYQDDHLEIEILGGIRLDRLDTMRTTLKMRDPESKNIHRHTLDLYNDNQVSRLIRRAAGKLELGMGSIIDSLTALTEELEAYRLEQRSEADSQQKEIKLTKEEIKAATELLKSKNLLETINDLIGKSGVIGEENNRLLMYVIFTSRKMSNPLHIISMGASGTGKSHLQESVAALLPEEDTLSVTDLSESSFYYFQRNELSHKLILIEDLDGLSGTGGSGALYALRELQSKKTITKTFVEKTQKGLFTTSRTVDGPVCVAGCTTREKIYEDNSNRSFLIYIDSSAKQDEQIMQHQRAVSAGQINESQKAETTNLLKNMQRLLKPVKVVNPYAEQLILPTSVFKPRRTNTHYLHFIEAVTFLHQLQRKSMVDEQTGEEIVKTTLEDIENANYLLKDILLKKSDRLSPACRSYLESLKMSLIGNKETTFTNRSMSFSLKIPLTTVKRYHLELYNNNYIRVKQKTKQGGFTYEIVSYEEYLELKKEIATILDTTLATLKVAEENHKKTSEKVVSPKSAQIKNGLVQ